MQFFENKLWSLSKQRVSIITPVFNRIDELKRAIESVKNQTYKDFEYIVVNDGSTIDIDKVVMEYLNIVDFPMLYIKKDNGGVHTARNLAIKYCRGEMIFPLDSDDEMKPNALEVLIGHWDKLSDNEKQEYREVCARCCDQNGNIIGDEFPININDYPLKKSHKIASKVKGEHLGFWRTDIMKNNPWPEPDGITFVMEGVLWEKLSKQYKSLYVNDVVLVYHLENDNSYVRTKTRTLQSLKNTVYSNILLLNQNPFYKCFERLILAIVFKNILSRHKHRFDSIKLSHFFHKVLYLFLFIPCWFLSYYYEKRKYKIID